jgi:hypothetical protein
MVAPKTVKAISPVAGWSFCPPPTAVNDVPPCLTGRSDRRAPEEAAVKEQETSPAVDTSGAERPARRPPNVVLLAVIVVLVAFGAVATTLYLRETAARADRDRTIAARTAELDAVRSRLDAAQTQLDAVRDLVTLDPKSYEAIKKCVQQAVESQPSSQPVNRFFDYPSSPLPAPPTGPTGGPPSDGGPPDPAICPQAATYLK